jgi:hypothetical protein
VTRYDELMRRLRDASQPARPAPAGFESYLAKVRSRAYEIGDADVQDLKDAGHSEDEIFEQTVSAAVASGLVRLDAALATLA